jgi:hypothetical protein
MPPGSPDALGAGAVTSASHEQAAGEESGLVPDRQSRSFSEGALIKPEQSAAALIAHLGGDDSGSVWDVSDATARV